MSWLELCGKVTKNYLLGQIVDVKAIGDSYNFVSNTYDTAFLSVMQQYNIAMLSNLAVPEQAKILDLACGTGFNAKWLCETYPSISIDGVDISENMLAQAAEKLAGRANFFNMSMLDYLRQCPENSYDIVVCGWALKYQPPLDVLSECKRVLKPGGQIGIIVNTKNTLPEVRKVFTKLLAANSKRLGNLMMELPNPRDKSELAGWFTKAGLAPIEIREDAHKFCFETAPKAVEWVTSTGALAGFDVMLDLRQQSVRKQMAVLFQQYGFLSITHTFVWGVATA